MKKIHMVNRKTVHYEKLDRLHYKYNEYSTLWFLWRQYSNNTLNTVHYEYYKHSALLIQYTLITVHYDYYAYYEDSSL